MSLLNFACLLIVLNFAESSHFRGAIIQWRPVDPDNFDGQIIITHRIAWRRTSITPQCDTTHINTTTLFGYGSLMCRQGCTDFTILDFFCTDFDIEEDWVTGEKSNTVNITENAGYFEAIFSGCCWISTLILGQDGDWNVLVKGSLTVRPDGRVNSSPVTASKPIIRLQQGCMHEIKIPTQDIDRDIVRCRWAEEALGECGEICNAFPNATLNSEQCIISYNAIDAAGLYAVAIQIEDFLTPASTTPLSSVPLQFIVDVFRSTQPCSAQPELVGETPEDGSCIPVEVGSTYTAGIVATSGGSRIESFSTVSPRGLIQTEVTQSMYNPDLYYTNVTWRPTLEQFGQIHIFCFSARNSEGLTSTEYCINLLGGVQGPRILPNSITPTGTLSLSPSTVWSMTFDQPVQRPTRSRFIKFYNKRTDTLVHSIDVTSPGVVFPEPESEGRAVTFSVDFTFIPGQTYYVLIDGGAAVGDSFCNQDSHHITSTSFWTFTAASIKLNPRFGNMLGGTAILINPGIPLDSDVTVTCNFGGTLAPASQLNSTLALCVSPTLDRLGFIDFILSITNLPDLESQYLSVSPERGHTVEISADNSDLLLVPDEIHTIIWSPGDLIPESILDGKSITVDISLYVQEYNTKSLNWRMISMLATDSPNDGIETITVPSLSVACGYPIGRLHFPVCPVAIKISISEGHATLPSSIGIWSGVVFLQDKSPKVARNMNAQCDAWSKDEITRVSVLERVQPCPPNQLVANFDVEYEREDRSSLVNPASEYEKDYMEFFHPNIQECYRQNVATREGQQCCYNSEGNLVKGPSSGGSVDSYSPKGNFNLHLLQDLLPYVLCCKAPNTPTCQTYYNARPSGSETGYELPVPACVYGDPHIVTLDGHKYTFNGKGEFTLVETLDNTFTLQGRMEAAVDPDGAAAPGTVFTAIVAKQLTTDTSVQFEVDSNDPSGSGLRVLVNGQEVTFDDISLLEFDDVALLDKRNNTVLSLFSSRANIEVKVENGIISVMLVGLPDNLRGKTRGLMGSLNGIPSDDLVPKGGSKGIPLDSSLEDIHNLFGITWIINDEESSLFTYGRGDSWSKFYCPTFSPMFEAMFDDPLLEEEARQACGEDEFCLFDIAATKRVEIGMATMNDGATFDEIVEMSVPIVCDPPCMNGVCLKGNNCSCNEGFEGNRCTEPIMEECDAEFCENGGTCTKQASSYSCQCPAEYEGSFCENKVPPFHIRFINSSPRVTEESLSVDFVTSKPASSRCFLNSRSANVRRNDGCSSGNIQYENLPSGQYTFRITSTTSSGERDIVRRRIYIGACAIHQINEGLTITEDAVSLQFVGTRNVTGYQCRLDQAETFEFCRSPVRYEDLSAGEHRLVVKPAGCKGESLSLKFNIE